MTKKDVLFVNDSEIKKAERDAENLLERATTLCHIWAAQKILPEMDRKHFDQVLQNGSEYFEGIYKKTYLENLEKMLPGMGDGFPMNPLPPNDYDRELFNRISRGLYEGYQNHPFHSGHVSEKLLEFKDGLPTIPKKAMTAIQQKCTIYNRGNNGQLLAAITELAKATNKVDKLFREMYPTRQRKDYFDTEKQSGQDARGAMIIEDGEYKPNLHILKYGL